MSSAIHLVQKHQYTANSNRDDNLRMLYVKALSLVPHKK